MSFIQNFSASQSALAPSEIELIDTSSGSDSNIAVRRVYCQDVFGNFLVPSGTTTDYVVWPYADLTITLDILDGSDKALNITVYWFSNSGSLYEKSLNFCFSEYSKQFLYALVQAQALTFNIIQDANYWSNVGIVWVNINSALNAISFGNDQRASQAALDRIQYMITNQSKFF